MLKGDFMDHTEELDRAYERCKAQNDWQGMAAIHASRMQSRKTVPDYPSQESLDIENLLVIAGLALFVIILFAGLLLHDPPRP